MIEVYKEVVKSVVDRVQETAIREPIHFDVCSMPGEGLAKNSSHWCMGGSQGSHKLSKIC